MLLGKNDRANYFFAKAVSDWEEFGSIKVPVLSIEEKVSNTAKMTGGVVGLLGIVSVKAIVASAINPVWGVIVAVSSFAGVAISGQAYENEKTFKEMKERFLLDHANAKLAAVETRNLVQVLSN